MLKSIADKLQCMGDSKVRLLRTTDAHQQIVAVESSLQDTPNNNSPCTIPINHAAPTICHSMIGSMKAYFAQGTPSQTLTDARDELLFFIRTTMSSGAYESAEVRKVIYIEDLSSGVVHSNPPPNVLVRQENGNETGAASLLTGVVVALSMIFVGLLGFLFMSRRRRRGVMLQQFPPSEVEDIAHSEVEEENYGVEDVESIWQEALNVYDNEDTKVEDPTDIANDDAGAAGVDRKDSVSVDPEGFLFKPQQPSSGSENEATVSEMEEAAPMPVSVENINVAENENEAKEPMQNEVDKDSLTTTSDDTEIDSEGK